MTEKKETRNSDKRPDLNARAIYDITLGLIMQYATKEDIDSLQEKPIPGTEKIWTHEDIRNEIGELVRDYLFNDLTPPYEDIALNLTSDTKSQIDIVEQYLDTIVARYNKDEQKNENVKPFFNELGNRSTTLTDEIVEISNLKGEEILNKARENARDGFGHSIMPYNGYIELASMNLG